jgi:hypothetical protein
MMMYSVHDPEVKLEDIATATPVMEHTLPDPPSVKGRERERERERSIFINFDFQLPGCLLRALLLAAQNLVTHQIEIKL